MGMPTTKPAAPRNKKKSKQALHKEQLNSKHTSCTGQQGSKIRQAGQGGMRCLREPRLPRVAVPAPVNLRQVTPGRVEILTSQGSL